MNHFKGLGFRLGVSKPKNPQTPKRSTRVRGFGFRDYIVKCDLIQYEIT